MVVDAIIAAKAAIRSAGRECVDFSEGRGAIPDFVQHAKERLGPLVERLDGAVARLA
jgi:hypothetical protein